MTKIEWASLGLPKGVTWNPIRARNRATSKRGWHCEKVSPACEHCYAEALNAKAGDTGGTGLPYKPGHRQNGDVEIYLDEKTLLQPLSWRAPRGVFVCSMTDIFGDWVKDEWLDRIFAVMALCPQHRFAVLTKRPKRMREYFAGNADQTRRSIFNNTCFGISQWLGARFTDEQCRIRRWPLSNIYLGATAEDQQRADERIPDLLATPAAVRFVSIEPMLGAIDLENIRDPQHFPGCLRKDVLNSREYHEDDGNQWTIGGRLDWVICGGESGPRARPMHPDWARSLRDQCKAAGVPFFFKQWGEWAPHAGVRLIEAGGTKASPFAAWPDGTICHGHADDHGGPAIKLDHVGKARAGRLLDDKEYSEFPEAK